MPGARSPTRGAHRTGLIAFPAVLAVVLLALPSTAAAPTAPVLRSYRAPYTAVGGVDGHSYSDGDGHAGGASGACATFHPYPRKLNLSTGILPVNNWMTACTSNGGAINSADIWVASGIGHLHFRAPSTGFYNITTVWSGSIWANVTVALNGSPRGTVWGNFTILTYLVVVDNQSYRNVSYAPIANGSANRSLATLVRVHGTASPVRLWLTAGRYELGDYLELHALGKAWVGSSPGARVKIAFHSDAGVDLKRITVG